MLELQLNRREKVLFLRVAEKRMKEKKLTKKQLAEKINRPYGTVRNYFYDLSKINIFEEVVTCQNQQTKNQFLRNGGFV